MPELELDRKVARKNRRVVSIHGHVDKTFSHICSALDLHKQDVVNAEISRWNNRNARRAHQALARKALKLCPT